MIFWWRENRLTFEQDCQLLKSMGFGVELWPEYKRRKRLPLREAELAETCRRDRGYGGLDAFPQRQSDTGAVE